MSIEEIAVWVFMPLILIFFLEKIIWEYISSGKFKKKWYLFGLITGILMSVIMPTCMCTEVIEKIFGTLYLALPLYIVLFFLVVLLVKCKGKWVFNQKRTSNRHDSVKDKSN